ncbi:MAG: response regulator [Spirochaetes bacterium]|nr:response regulator [Spirochaetota bacterium]
MGMVRIIIVEDEIIISHDLKSMLEMKNYEVIGCCTSGDEVLDYLDQNEAPDLIIMDVTLSGKMDGIETAQNVKSKYNIPVIFLTAFSDDKTIERAKSTFPIGYILKPISRNELYSTIEISLYKFIMEQRLCEVEQRVNDIIQFLPLAIFAIDNDGRVIAWNKSIEELTAVKADEMIGKDNFEYSMPFYGYRRKMLIDFLGDDCSKLYEISDDEESKDGSLTAVVKLNLKNRPDTFLWKQAGLLYDTAGKISGAIEVMRDVSDEIRIRNELKYSENKFFSIFMVSPQSIAIAERKTGKLLEVNDSFCENLKSDRSQIINKNIAELNILIETNIYQEIRELILNNKEFRNYEINFVVNNRKIYLLLSGSPVYLDGKECVIIIMENITEVRELQKEISEVVEDERFRIGRDLHDDLGQLLTGATFMLQSLKNDISAGLNVTVNEIERIEELVRSAVGKTRNISKMLSPVDIDEKGFVIAVEEMIKQLEEVFLITFTLKKSGNLNIGDPFKAVNLYYIAREAINNSIKHSNSDDVIIELMENDRILTMVIEDDGTGFDGDKNVKGGMGLRTMQYRANLIGAKIRYEINESNFKIVLTVNI